MGNDCGYMVKEFLLKGNENVLKLSVHNPINKLTTVKFYTLKG